MRPKSLTDLKKIIRLLFREKKHALTYDRNITTSYIKCISKTRRCNDKERHQTTKNNRLDRNIKHEPHTIKYRKLVNVFIK